MVYNECNLWAGIYKVQTFGTTQSIIAMVICRNKNHEHTEDEWSQGKGELLASMALWGKHRAMVEPWGFTGIKPQSRRAHGGRTNGDDYPGSNWVGFLGLDGKEF